MKFSLLFKLWLLGPLFLLGWLLADDEHRERVWNRIMEEREVEDK